MKKGLVLILIMFAVVLAGCKDKEQEEQLEAAKAKIVDLVAELDVVKAERDDLKIDLAAANVTINEMKDKVALLESVEKGKDVLQQQYDNLKASSAETMDKLKEWKAKAEKYLSENEKLQDMIAKLKEKAGNIELPGMPKTE